MGREVPDHQPDVAAERGSCDAVFLLILWRFGR